MENCAYLLMTGETSPEEALSLPKGRLKLGEFVVDFSPEQVLCAAQSIVEHFERAEGHEVSMAFVSQAGVIAYSTKEFGLGKLEAKTF